MKKLLFYLLTVTVWWYVEVQVGEFRHLYAVLIFCTGAGGLVVNEKNQILAVCEKFRTKQHWKLPGGMVDRGL